MTFDPPIYQALAVYHFVLASTSARRLEILVNNLGIPRSQITIMAPNFEEDLSKDSVTASHYVTETAKHKGKAVIDQIAKSSQFSPDKDIIVLTSDTIVSCNEQIFEKPGTKTKQFDMFCRYKQHPDLKVLTAVNIITIGAGQVKNWLSALESTSLKFNCQLEEEFLKSYVDSEEGLNVSGGFKYQGIGSLLFKGIDGDYFNVVGLPVATTFRLLAAAINENSVPPEK